MISFIITRVKHRPSLIIGSENRVTEIGIKMMGVCAVCQPNVQPSVPSFNYLSRALSLQGFKCVAAYC